MAHPEIVFYLSMKSSKWCSRLLREFSLTQSDSVKLHILKWKIFDVKVVLGNQIFMSFFFRHMSKQSCLNVSAQFHMTDEGSRSPNPQNNPAVIVGSKYKDLVVTLENGVLIL